MLESNYNTIVISDLAWGDSAKGKFSDFYASKWADVVVRSQGGNNAGHTVVIDGKKYAVRGLPSGVFTKNVLNVIGNGCVINPIQMVQEIEYLKNNGITDFQLAISAHTHIITEYHKQLDNDIEEYRIHKVKTTGNGIGPCYADKKYRLGIRMCDICYGTFEELSELVQDAITAHSLYYDVNYIDALVNNLLEAGKRLKEYVCDTSLVLEKAINEHKNIVFEGAQGAMLDNDYGFYPYVTSSCPTSAGIASGCGIPPKYIDNVLGIVKAYSTRVGTGPFVTELEDSELTNKIRETGHEYGTVTGRPRRIGWIDLFILKQANRINGTTGLAITLLDVLTGIDKLKVCIGYKDKNGNNISSLPPRVQDIYECTPIYKDMEGWQEDITHCKHFEDLPKQARTYIEYIEHFLDVDVEYISVGPDRNQIISK